MAHVDMQSSLLNDSLMSNSPQTVHGINIHSVMTLSYVGPFWSQPNRISLFGAGDSDLAYRLKCSGVGEGHSSVTICTISYSKISLHLLEYETLDYFSFVGKLYKVRLQGYWDIVKGVRQRFLGEKCLSLFFSFFFISLCLCSDKVGEVIWPQ